MFQLITYVYPFFNTNAQCILFQFLNCVHCFFLGITASLSSGVNDRAMNLYDNYEKTPNIEVSNQG